MSTASGVGASYRKSSHDCIDNGYSIDSIFFTDHQTSKYRSIRHARENNSEKRGCCAKCLKSIFRRKTLNKRFPILTWLPKYSKSDAIGDLIAGLTVGLLLVPQGLAYANVAGLPSQFGLYGAFFGSFIYVLLGTCKDNTVGTTAIASLLTFQVAKGVWQRAVLLTFLTGIIEILMSVFRLSFLVDFVSGPVSAGFTSAAACIVVTSQVKSILGVRSDGETFLQRWISMISDIQNTRLPDAVLGVTCIFVLIAIKFIIRIRVGPKANEAELKATRFQRGLNKALWLLGVTKNAILVIACTLISRYLYIQGRNPFKLTGYIPRGLPSFGFPAFSLPAVSENATAGIEAQPGETFIEIVSHLGNGLFIVPIIALLENNAVCKTFAKGKATDATQELFAIGMANIANSLVSGYRANGGLTRASINEASGARTPMTNFYIGAVVVLSLLFLTEYFFFIPQSVLAAIIIAAVIFQLQYHLVMPVWRSKRTDLIPGLVCFVACLVLPLEVGIFIAIAVNILFILYESARPNVTIESFETTDGTNFLKLTPDRCLIFPSVEFVRSTIVKHGFESNLPVVIDCTYIYATDFTAAKAISSMAADFKSHNRKLVFFNLKPSLVEVFKGLNTKLETCYNTEKLQILLSCDGISFDSNENLKY